MTHTIKLARSRIGLWLLAGFMLSGIHHIALGDITPDWQQKIYGIEFQRDAYLKSARQQIFELKAKVDVLNIKAKTSSHDARLRLEALIQGFQDDLRDLDQKSVDLKNSRISTWDEEKNDLDASIKKLHLDIEEASN